MASYISNVIIYTGVDFKQTFILSNEDDSSMDLTGYNAESKIKRHSASNSSIPFTISFLNRRDGRLQISLTSTQTRQLKSGKYYYDLILIDENEKKKKVVEGEVFIKTAVTR